MHAKPKTYFIHTFGCQQNHADSERVRARFHGRGMVAADTIEEADHVVINTCMIREKAENKVYGLVHNLGAIKERQMAAGEEPMKIVVTGCMVGIAFRDKTGLFLKKIKKAMPAADEFMPIEEIGFDFAPVRTSKTAAWVPISNGCNNFCTFCIVPFTRGREISRPYADVIAECQELRNAGYVEVTLLGQNVNSYGADLIVGADNVQVMRDLPEKDYFHGAGDDASAPAKYEVNGRVLEPVYVQHLGRKRIPTLFPHLLEEVAQMGFERVDFVSSNPWDFSDELIDVIARNKNVTRVLHLPVQHGSEAMLRRMNRWYTPAQYLDLVRKIRAKVPDVKFTTDIIVGFCNESEEEFNDLVELCREVGFYKAYVAMYSSRPMTAATKVMEDNVPHPVKKARWETLDQLINQPNLESFHEDQYHMHKKVNYAG